MQISRTSTEFYIKNQNRRRSGCFPCFRAPSRAAPRHGACLFLALRIFLWRMGIFAVQATTMRICSECRKSNESNGQNTLSNCGKRKLNMKKSLAGIHKTLIATSPTMLDHSLLFLHSLPLNSTKNRTDSVFHDPRLSAKSAVYIHLRLCRARLLAPFRGYSLSCCGAALEAREAGESLTR